MDLLPTFAKLADSALPPSPIDGHDIRPLLFDEPDAKSPWDAGGFFFYQMDQLQAVRAGPWKLYLELPNKYMSLARKEAPSKLALFDVRNDVSETREASAHHPDIVKRLLAFAERARRELGDGPNTGTGQRPAGVFQNPMSLLLPVE